MQTLTLAIGALASKTVFSWNATKITINNTFSSQSSLVTSTKHLVVLVKRCEIYMQWNMQFCTVNCTCICEFSNSGSQIKWKHYRLVFCLLHGSLRLPSAVLHDCRSSRKIFEVGVLGWMVNFGAGSLGSTAPRR